MNKKKQNKKPDWETQLDDIYNGYLASLDAMTGGDSMKKKVNKPKVVTPVSDVKEKQKKVLEHYKDFTREYWKSEIERRLNFLSDTIQRAVLAVDHPEMYEKLESGEFKKQPVSNPLWDAYSEATKSDWFNTYSPFKKIIDEKFDLEKHE